jgi:hypothetical protein
MVIITFIVVFFVLVLGIIAGLMLFGVGAEIGQRTH